MRRKGNWFTAVKKALNPELKENYNKESSAGKLKKKWFKKKRRSAGVIDTPAETTPTVSTTLPPPLVVPPLVVPPPSEPAKLSAVDTEQTKHAYTVALATARAAEAAVAAAEAAVAAAQAAAEVVRLTATAPPFAGKSEEIAAIRIQTVFRGYMARRTLRALRGLVRLKTVMQGQAIKRQTANTLKSMQALARVQTQVRERRQKVAEENFARQKLVQQKNAREQAKELEKSQKILQKNGDGWDSSAKTKEQIKAKMQNRHEAAIRRERTMAYAFTHQQTWKAASMSAHTMFMDVNNPHWGWSWLERWLASRPWENAITPDKDTSNENSPRIKPSKTTKEITKSYARFLQNTTTEKPSPTSAPKKPLSSAGAHISTSSAPSKPIVAARKLRYESPKSSPRMSTRGQDDDPKSTLSSMPSEQQSRRNSVTGSSVRDDESLGSSQTVPSYMAPTESTKARSSRLGNQKRETSVTPDRSSVSSVKKRGGSQAASPVRSRRSTSSITDVNSLS